MARLVEEFLLFRLCLTIILSPTSDVVVVDDTRWRPNM